jgi:soluble lytic murein transglycosylase-like protein
MQNQKVPVTGLLLMALIAFSMSVGDLAARFAPKTVDYPPAAVEGPVAAVTQTPPVALEQEALVEHLSSKYNRPTQFVSRIVKAAYREARQVGMSPLLVLAVIEKESGLDPKARSSYGAVGLMQVVPRYHLDKIRSAGGGGAYDPDVNIRVGTAILADYRRANRGDIGGALLQYSGQARGYVQRVTLYRQELEEVKAQALRRT